MFVLEAPCLLATFFGYVCIYMAKLNLDCDLQCHFVSMSCKSSFWFHVPLTK